MKPSYPKKRGLAGATIVDKSDAVSSKNAISTGRRQRILANDLSALKNRAFTRIEKMTTLLARFHAVEALIDAKENAQEIWNLYDWLLVPFSLWPLDLVGMSNHLLDTIEVGGDPDRDMIFLLNLLGRAPSEDAAMVMGAYEHEIMNGRYEKLVRHIEKFDELERSTALDDGLKTAWETLSGRFNLAKYRDKRGIVRRQFSRERNFRDYLTFKWKSKDERFRILFDVFCHRWNLYGIEHETPLLMKITVNPTPHGTMVFIPRYWSFDPHRDLAWREICRLHRAHGAPRQGPKLSTSRQDRRDEAIIARQALTKAKELELKGERRREFVLAALNKDPRTDWSYVRRLNASPKKPNKKTDA